VSADLDGDGSAEEIVVRESPGMDVVVSIGEAHRWIYSGLFDGRAEVVELDPEDGRRELRVGKNLVGYDGHQPIGLISGVERRGPLEVIFGERDGLVHLIATRGEDVVRSVLPAHLCRPKLELTTVGGPDDVRAFAIEYVSWGPEEEPHGDFSSYLWLENDAALSLLGPWVLANSFRVEDPDELVVTSFDCGVRRSETWRRVDGEMTRGASHEDGERDPAMCGRAVLLAADLDGDGRDEEIIVNQHNVWIDRVRSEITEVPAGHLLMEENPSFEPRLVSVDSRELSATIVDADSRDGRREVLVSYHGIEDSISNVLFSFDGTQISVSPAVWSPSELVIDGSGRLTVGYGNCGRRYTEQWRFADGRLGFVRRRAAGRFRDDRCAACPFVYVHGRSGPSRVGEILRDQRAPELEGWQGLTLGPVTASPLRVRIVEELDEVTHLDAIVLDYGGVIVRPRSCDSPEPPAFCSDDGQYVVLRGGDAIEIELDVPVSVYPPPRPVLRADGYYTR